MASSFLKSSVLQESVLTALAKMLSLSPTVWRDAGGNFRGASGDTVTIRVPAYTVADDRVLRSGSSRSRRGLFEAPVAVTLNHNLYRDVPLSDEEQTLDIRDFARQVVNPILGGIARGIEDVLIEDAITAANYEHEVDFDPDDAYSSLVQARKHLNDSRVPFANRTFACGTSLAAALINSPNLRDASQSGTTATLREGFIGRIAGFDAIESPGLDPDEGYAYHNTAYCLSTQAPVVPAGAPAGFVANQDGFAIRLVQILDSSSIENIVAADVFCGASAVMDHGTVDGDGVFTPSEEPDTENNTDQVFVRGVKLAITGS